MSKLDIVNAEITRREESIQSIIDGKAALLIAIEQFNKLDEFYRDQEKDSRNTLECIYKENRHFTGQQPNVYSFALTEIYPFFAQTDGGCNPYFPISKVQDGTFDGLAPLDSPVTRSDVYIRANPFAATEDVPRGPALTELQSFPDISNEPLPANWPAAQASGCSGEDNPPQLTEGACIADNGVWGPIADPVWNGPDTAPALLRVPLTAWRDDMIIIRDDICLADAAEVAYWQDLIDDADLVLAAIVSDAVFVRATGDGDPAAWGQTQAFTGATEAARARLETAADTGIVAHKATRQAKLTLDGETEEKIFFGLIGLRLHQANGSFAKVKSSKKLDATQDSIKADHESALELLN